VRLWRRFVAQEVATRPRAPVEDEKVNGDR
jgi:hypothetical protein